MRPPSQDTGWLDNVTGAEGLLHVFGGVPDASEVVLRELCLRDGHLFTVRFDLLAFPDPPPSKWAERGANTVQVGLLLVGIRFARVEGLVADSRVRFSLTRLAKDIRLLISGQVAVRAEAEKAVVASISAYRCDPV